MTFLACPRVAHHGDAGRADSNGAGEPPHARQCSRAGGFSVAIALAKFPAKTQEQIAERVGCAQSYVQRVKSESGRHNITRDITDSIGRRRPTRYNRRASQHEAEPERSSLSNEARLPWLSGRI